MSDKKPMNDAMEHMKNIEGSVPTKIEMNKLPKLLRYFGYFVFGFFAVSIIIVIIGNLLN
ncbi:MAG: amino acid transporter [Paenisporosarcina sp.]